jgi:hypothetical protein
MTKQECMNAQEKMVIIFVNNRLAKNIYRIPLILQTYSVVTIVAVSFQIYS